MKKRLIMLVALLAVVAIAVPAFALEFKYGGMYRLRWQSNDNLADGGGEGFWLDNRNNYLPGYGNRTPGGLTALTPYPHGRSDTNDNQNYMDQRLRMYFSFVASENLQVVSKFEIDNIWGYQPDKFSGGGGVGADAINIEVKNVYVDFNVPYTPVRATLGVQGIQLMTGWVLDDDFSAAKFSAKFDPITVTVGYVSGQNSDVSTSYDNIDDWFISLDYASGPFKAGLLGFLQNGHNTNVSTFMNPRMATGSAGGGVAANNANTFNLFGTNLATGGANGLSILAPNSAIVGTLYPSMATNSIGTALAVDLAQPGWQLTSPTVTAASISPTTTSTARIQSATLGAGTSASYYERNTAWTYGFNLPVADGNYLFDLGLNFEYKLDWIKAYINFVKNFGGFTFGPGWADQDIDYTGYLIDAGVNFYYGPFTFTVNGFLASGDNFSDDVNPDSDGNFRYPRGASHYWSEILGMGSLDSILGGSNLNSVRTTASSSNAKDTLSDSSKRLPGDYGWQGADTPSNLWMINVGAAYQALEKTKLTLNYYYIGTQQDVLSGTWYDPVRGLWYGEYSKSIGSELDFYVDQGIVDGLNLRLVFAYLWANDGYTIYSNDGNSWETGFVLQWNF